MDADQTPYELFALPREDDGAAARQIGRYGSYKDAVRARGDAVCEELAARDGWYALIEHLIVGPGLRGPRTVHCLATALGVDPAAGTIPDASDLTNARRWLAAIHLS